MIATISLIAIFHHTKLLQHYWLYCQYCIFSWFIYFFSRKFVRLNPLHLFPQSAFLSTLPIISFFSVTESICFLVKHVSEIIQCIWFISVKIPSRSTHVAGNGKISFSFRLINKPLYILLFHYICVYVYECIYIYTWIYIYIYLTFSFSIHLLIDT